MSADANYTNIALAPETSYGVLPGSPVFQTARLTGESFGHAKDTVVSEELRSDRQIPDMAKVGSSATGGFNFELSYAEFQTLFEAVLCGTWDPFSVTATCAIAPSTQTITAGTPGDLSDIPVGGYVRVAGAATASNNGIFRVLTNTGTVITLPAASLTTVEASISLTISGKDLRNGIARRSFTAERRLVNNAGADFFQQYLGLTPGKLMLNVESKKIITGSFDFLGKYGQTSNNSISTAGTPATGTLTATAIPTNNQTVTIDGTIYTFKTALSTSPAVAYEVLIGATAETAYNNLVTAINRAAGEGTTYSTGTEAHPTVSAVEGTDVAATATLTSSGVNVSNGNTVTINGKVYTFETSLTNVDGHVLIGADADASLDNLKAAVTLGAGSGTTYAAATTAHPTVTATTNTATTQLFVALTAGAAGNLLTIAKVAATLSVSAATFAGGTDLTTITALTAGTGGNSITTTETVSGSFAGATLAGGGSSLYVASTANPTMNGTNNIGRLENATAAFSEKMKMVSFGIDNNLRGKDALGENGNFEIGLGQISVAGKFSVYFDNNDLYQALINHDDTALSFLVTDDDGASLGFTFPRVKFGTGNPNAGAINTDVMLDVDFQAIRDPDTDSTCIVSAIAA